MARKNTASGKVSQGVWLITGGAGFIGSHITEALVARGQKARVFDNFSTGRRQNIEPFLDRIELVEGDLNDEQAVAQAVKGVEVIFHEAALPSVPRSIADPVGSNKANIDGTVNLLWAAKEAGVRRVVYAASSSAYGNAPEFPRVETILPAPLSPYAVGKLACEYYLRCFMECYGLETISLRYFNIFGPRQNPKSQYAAAIPLFTTAILSGQPPTVYGDGEQSRDFTYIANVVSANLLAAQAPKSACGRVYNVGCGDSVTINHVIAQINQVLGTNVRPVYAPPRAGDPKKSNADISLARQHLGYTPIVAFEEGLVKTVEYFRNAQNP